MSHHMELEKGEKGKSERFCARFDGEWKVVEKYDSVKYELSVVHGVKVRILLSVFPSWRDGCSFPQV